MFNNARLKLTTWYLLIIMLISISFSFAIYEILTFELDRVEHMQRARQEKFSPITLHPLRSIDLEVIEETKDRLKIRLLIINLGILSFAGLAGYFLAGRTLRPIKEMVDEQNRFITDASHELRTPLTSIKSEIEVNLRDKKLNLSDAKKLLQSNLEEVNNLQYLSDNLIKLSQNQTVNRDELFEKVLLKDVIDEAVKKAEKLANFKNITIVREMKHFTITGERQSLIELFVILLDNAIKYSPKNSKVIINLSRHPRGGRSNFVEIQVKDQGMGIAKEDMPHLFDRFYRADKSRGSAGYGLGLSIAKQIVEKNKGNIKVESEISKGSTFTVYLPAKA